MQRILMILTLVLYVLACFFPALAMNQLGSNQTATNTINWSGVEVLGAGWMAVFVGNIAWFANPFWLLGWFCLLFRRPIWARIWFVIAVSIALTTFMLFGQVLPADEAGVNKMTLGDLLLGGYLWFASMGIGLIGAFFTTRKRR